MTTQDLLLKTQQVADALGVSVSTVKRWVDAGTLRASRTPGRHRLISWSEAVRFAREQELPSGRLERLAEAVPTEAEGDQLRDALTQALCAGWMREARRLILAAHASGRGAAALGDDLIRPVMERVGHRWQFEGLDVYQEHRASAVVDATLRELVQAAARRTVPGSPLALGASPEGDLYTLPNLLCELTLREAGWEVMDLGANLPLNSLANAVRRHHPRLAWLSVNHLSDSFRFEQHYSAFSEAASTMGTAIILGGRALRPDLRARLVCTGYGERMADLNAFARRLHPAGEALGVESTDRPRTDQP